MTGGRILIHAQHLTGVGHRVRSREIARELARAHRVQLVDGGRTVPWSDPGAGLERVGIPALIRARRGLEPLDPGVGLEVALRRRARSLRDAAAALAPDIVVVEHFPFSKWELRGEILALLEAARTANPRLRVVCSLRDVCRRTRHEAAEADAWQAQVLRDLGAHFDALLVHADPQLTRLEEHFGSAAEIPVPVIHTGIVSQKPLDGASESAPQGCVVVSCGGGAGGAELARRCLDAWRLLVRRAETRGRSLVVFGGLFWPESVHSALRRALPDAASLEPFRSDFLGWLSAADLSISRAGYNTCANLLETRCPGILVPDARMSDQPFRAQRLHDRGLASAIPETECSPERIAEAVRKGLATPRIAHGLDLDGAARTRQIVEALLRSHAGRI